MNLTLQNLTLTQGDFRLELDLELCGQVIGVFGSSGAGKTSLLEIIAGLRRPSTGRIMLDDVVLGDRTKGLFLSPEKRGIGYVPQDLALFPHLSVRGNLLYGHRANGSRTGLGLDHVAEVLEIAPLLDRGVGQLSGGQKQRVAFARALLAGPRLLLLDEPLASLDHDLKQKILPYLQRIRDEFSLPMLYVSHSPQEMIALCNQVLLLREGRCVQVRPPGELFEPVTTLVLKTDIR